MSAKKDEKRALENAALRAAIKEQVDAVETRVDAMDNIRDPAQKILALIELREDLHAAVAQVDRLQETLARKRAARTPRTYAKRVALTLTCMTIVGGMALYTSGDDPDWTSIRDIEKERAKLRDEPMIRAEQKRLADCVARTGELLAAATELCDLQELSKSRHFARLYKVYEPVRDRFQAAAAAQSALGDKRFAPAEKPPAQQAAAKPAGKSIDPARYDHFIKGV